MNVYIYCLKFLKYGRQEIWQKSRNFGKNQGSPLSYFLDFYQISWLAKNFQAIDADVPYNVVLISFDLVASKTLFFNLKYVQKIIFVDNHR